MARFDDIGLFWEDVPTSRKGGKRVLGPIPPIPDTGWRPPIELPDLRNAPVISFDTETYDPGIAEGKGPGWARGVGHICGMSVAIPGHRWYFPMRHEVEPEYNMDPERVLAWARVMFDTPHIPKVGANITYDIGWLRQEGVYVTGELHDVQHAESLLDEEAKVSLEQLGNKYCGIGKDVDILKEWILNYYGGSQTKWRKDIYRAPTTLTGAYGEQDASLPLEVFQKQINLIRNEGLEELYRMECDLIPMLIDMRFAGVSVDIPYTEKLIEQFTADADIIKKKMHDVVGFDVNPNASASLAKAFDKLGIPYPRTAPTASKKNGNPSFVKEFLETHTHQFPQMITQLKQKEKLIGTFLQGYILDSQIDGKVYGQFHALKGLDGGAKTGRFSSSTPNLQNIPARSEDGKKIRRCFIPDKGHKQWRKYDYSQIEYRCLAHFAVGEGASRIREQYRKDPRTDYHSTTQELIKSITGVELARAPTKNINFGLIYGLGIDALAKGLDLSVAETKALVKSYHEGVPFAKQTMKAASDFVEQYGYNATILGRRTRFNQWERAGWGKSLATTYENALKWYGSDSMQRAFLYRALNYKLQGTAADIMKKSMLQCYKSGVFNATGIPRLTVHDELDFSDCGSKEANEGFKEMRHIMETALPLSVPVICDLEIGPNWGDVVDA